MVAIVNEKGRVSTIGIGDAIITATTSDEGFTNSCNISVVPIDVSAIEITNCLQIDMEQNTTYRLFTNVTPSDASNKQVTWNTADSLVATVNLKGKVSTITPGNTTITATTVDGGFVDSCSISVEPVGITGLSINNCLQTALTHKSRYKLLPDITPFNASNTNIIWTSSNPQVAIVNNKGRISTLGVGSTVIMAETEDGGLTAACSIEVVPVSVTGITIDNCPSSTLNQDTTYKLLTVIEPSNSTNEAVIWSSSNPQVATVNTKGKVSTLESGSTIITVTTDDGAFSNFCDISIGVQATIGEGMLIDGTAESNDINLYLNVVNPELLTIESTVDEFRFSLYSTNTGDMIMSKQVNEKTSLIDVSGLHEGLYLVQIHYPNGHYSTYKIMIR